MNHSSKTLALRGEIVFFTEDPDIQSDALQYFADGVVIIDQGQIQQVGEAKALLGQLGVGVGELVESS